MARISLDLRAIYLLLFQTSLCRAAAGSYNKAYYWSSVGGEVGLDHQRTGLWYVELGESIAMGL
jgi:hypothetical protein